MAKKSSDHRPQRLQPRARQELIVSAAIDTISQQGMHQVTLSQIAKLARIRQPLVNYYYPSLESLLHDCVKEVLANLKQHMLTTVERAKGQPWVALRNYCLSVMDWLELNPSYQPIWLYFYHLSAVSDRFRKLNEEIRSTGRERISLLIFQTLEKNKMTLAGPWSVETLAWTIQSMVTGYLTMAATEHSELEKIKIQIALQVDGFVAPLLGEK